MPYNIKTNYRDCSGYAVVGPAGDVLGCHLTRDEALGQQAALYSAEDKIWAIARRAKTEKLWNGSSFDKNVDKTDKFC